MIRCSSTVLTAALTLTLVFVMASPASARHVAGLKISNVSVAGPVADFDITLATDGSAGGFLGNFYATTSSSTFPTTYTTTTTTTTTTCFTTSTPTTTMWTTHTPSSSIHTYTSTFSVPTTTCYPTTTWTTTTISGTVTIIGATQKTLLQPPLPAIDYGDGATVQSTTIPFAASGPPNVYRGSFSHTYPAAGNYTIRTGVFSIDPATSPTTGNPVIIPAGGSFSYRKRSTWTTHYPTSSTSNWSYSSTISSHPTAARTIGLTNTATVGISVPVELKSFDVSENDSKPIPPAHEHPAVPLAAAALCAGLGLVLLRKT